MEYCAMPHNQYPSNSVGETLDDSRFRLIHNATLAILEKRGIRVECPELVKLATRRGIKSDGNILFFNEDQVENAICLAPSQFTLLARNPRYHTPFDLDSVFFGTGRSAPFVMSTKGVRRQATCQDYVETMKLGQMLDPIRLMGALVYPGDIPVHRLYEFMMAAQILYSDKPYIVSCIDDLKLLCRAFDVTPEVLRKPTNDVFAQATINTLSPLALAGDQGKLLMGMARHNIAICISPCPSSGMTGPCSLMGNVVLNNCEILSALVLVQLLQPGLPIFYGAFPCGTDMRSMCVTLGGPESRIMADLAAGVAKRYGLLTRGNVGMNDSQECDFHAGAESMFNFVCDTRNRINFLPGCGILAGFASASREKLIMDAELAEYVQAYTAFKERKAEALDDVVELLITLGPHDSFMTQPHTMAGFRTELFHPRLFPRTSYDKWATREKSLVQRTSDRANEMLAAYEMPSIDSDLKEELEQIVLNS